MRKRDYVLILAAASMSAGFGDPVYFPNKKGNELYSQERYHEALDEYRKAQLGDPESNAVDYNLGNAMYKLGKYDEAAKAYARAMSTEDGELRRKSGFNLGALLYRSGSEALEKGGAGEAEEKLKESINQYKALLKDNPSDDDSRHNLELALEKLKEAEKLKEQKEQEERKDKQDQGKEGEKDRSQNSGESQQNKEGQRKAEKERQEEDKGEQRKDERQAERQDKSGQDKEKKDSQPSKQEEISPEQAGRIFRAIEQDERGLREKLRAQEFKETPKTGKDW